jgi:Cd2+/Zn2+-exporting ATPase
MVMALYSIAELIEARSVDRARNAIQGLMALAPEVAEVQQPDGSWVGTPVAAIAVGAVIRVKPGERVPSDGKVLTGNSAVDQASVTGESIPVDKAPGDPVFAATINQTGALEITVTAKSTDSTLSRIIRSVEQAQGARAPTQRFVDQRSSGLRSRRRSCYRCSAAFRGSRRPTRRSCFSSSHVLARW